jgi:hypothetical protein
MGTLSSYFNYRKVLYNVHIVPERSATCMAKSATQPTSQESSGGIMTTVVKSAQAYVVTDAPDFEDILQAAEMQRTLILKTARFSAGVKHGDTATAKCDFEALELYNICRVKFDLSERMFSFEGESRHYYEHSSYNQSSTRCEKVQYRVEVRWRSHRVDGIHYPSDARASLIVL